MSAYKYYIATGWVAAGFRDDESSPEEHVVAGQVGVRIYKYTTKNICDWVGSRPEWRQENVVIG